MFTMLLRCNTSSDILPFQLHSFAAARKKLTTFLAELHIPKSTLQPRSRRARIAKLTAENKTQSTRETFYTPEGRLDITSAAICPHSQRQDFVFFFLKWLISPKSLANVCREKTHGVTFQQRQVAHRLIVFRSQIFFRFSSDSLQFMAKSVETEQKYVWLFRTKYLAHLTVHTEAR